MTSVSELRICFHNILLQIKTIIDLYKYIFHLILYYKIISKNSILINKILS